MIELQYESKFDGFLVDLRIGPAEELNQAMFGGEPVFTYKRGATVSADTMPAGTSSARGRSESPFSTAPTPRLP